MVVEPVLAARSSRFTNLRALNISAVYRSNDIAQCGGPTQPPPKTLYISHADVYRELGMRIAASLLAQQ
jgi:hypothetical protein